MIGPRCDVCGHILGTGPRDCGWCDEARQPTLGEMTKAEAVAEAARLERLKSDRVPLGWRAAYDPVKGWHVALVTPLGVDLAKVPGIRHALRLLRHLLGRKDL